MHSDEIAATSSVDSLQTADAAADDDAGGNNRDDVQLTTDKKTASPTTPTTTTIYDAVSSTITAASSPSSTIIHRSSSSSATAAGIAEMKSEVSADVSSWPTVAVAGVYDDALTTSSVDNVVRHVKSLKTTASTLLDTLQVILFHVFLYCLTHTINRLVYDEGTTNNH